MMDLSRPGAVVSVKCQVFSAQGWENDGFEATLRSATKTLPPAPEGTRVMTILFAPSCTTLSRTEPPPSLPVSGLGFRHQNHDNLVRPILHHALEDRLPPKKAENQQ